MTSIADNLIFDYYASTQMKTGMDSRLKVYRRERGGYIFAVC